MDRNCDKLQDAAGPLATEASLPLRLATPGQPCRVTEVRGVDDDAERLKQMGLCVGRQVQLIQAGDPLIVRLYGSRMALSARLAEAISVVPMNCCRA